MFTPRNSGGCKFAGAVFRSGTKEEKAAFMVDIVDVLNKNKVLLTITIRTWDRMVGEVSYARHEHHIRD
jgi:hypothetical protein